MEEAIGSEGCEKSRLTRREQRLWVGCLGEKEERQRTTTGWAEWYWFCSNNRQQHFIVVCSPTQFSNKWKELFYFFPPPSLSLFFFAKLIIFCCFCHLFALPLEGKLGENYLLLYKLHTLIEMKFFIIPIQKLKTIIFILSMLKFGISLI